MPGRVGGYNHWAPENMSSIKKELEAYGLAPRKKWGQHFLVDRNILRKVLRTADVGPQDVVLEVGPGLGEMTLALAQEARKVMAVEIDRKLAEVLRQKVSGFPNVEIIQNDILQLDFLALLGNEEGPVKVVANLPYQISTPLLFQFIDSRQLFSSLTLMVQREVAERMIASPGSKDYGPLSVLVQVLSDILICFHVKPSAFFPPPRVDSSVIQITWRKKALIAANDEEWLRAVVRGALGYRRKTLINALKHSGLVLPLDLEERLADIHIDLRRRPETLTIDEFIRLASILKPAP
jgi:16S rRNA (adenine1518-N6/adenine1519-N6)-dimethyltransferase